MNPRSLGLRLTLFGALACAGCAGTLEDPSAFTTDGGVEATTTDGGGCPDIPTSVFQAICAASGCHSAADRVQNLDLQSAGAALRLVNVPAQGGGLLIDPSQPSQSVIYEKLTAMPPFGSRMPLGKAALDDGTLACVLAWVSMQTAVGAGSNPGESDGGGVDAGGTDAGGTDADGGAIGSTDAGAVDSGRVDAGPHDAGHADVVETG
jgi:hypothetical protein